MRGHDDADAVRGQVGDEARDDVAAGCVQAVEGLVHHDQLGLGDLLGALLIPRGAPNPLLTMTAALGVLVYGLLLYSPEGYEFTKKQLIVRVIAANLIISLVLNLTMNTLSIALMYGGDNVLGYALASLPARAVKESIMFVIRSLCLIAITLPEGRVKKIFSTRS